MKPLVIYHKDCADGFGAAFAAWLRLGDAAEYLPLQYDDTDTHLEYTGRDLYILDFSFPREVMNHMAANARHMVWLDHHKTAFDMWCDGIPDKGWLSELMNCTPDNPRGTVEIHLHNNKSGAYLAWEYFHPGEEVPMLIKHIDDHDRWQFKIEGTLEFNKVLWSHAPWNFEQWDDFCADTGFSANDGTGVDEWYKQGEAILRAHNQNVRRVVGGSRKVHLLDIPYNEPLGEQVGLEPCEIWNASGLAANCPPHLVSDVGHELAVQSGTFGLCWTLSKTGLIANCSLRSTGGYDVSAIAKAFGGGGHRNAAGFEVPINTLLEWLK